MKAKIQSKLSTNKRVELQDIIPLSTPFLIYVDPSSLCNFKCKFCPTGHKDLLRESDYKRGMLDLNLFKKFIDDLNQFENPLKVLRMNKIGEPLLNKSLPEMIKYAKESGRVQYIDLATNGSLLSNDFALKLVESGLDRLNISVEGINKKQYFDNALIDFDFDNFLENIKWLFKHKKECEITIKIPGNFLSEEEKETFYKLFGDYCDFIFIEDLAPIWPEFDLASRADITIQEEQGQYQQPLEQKAVCTYIFYAMALNADGTISACCPDWDQKLTIGDLKNDSLYDIWNSDSFNKLRVQHLKKLRYENPTCAKCGHIAHAQIDNIDKYANQLLSKFTELQQ